MVLKQLPSRKSPLSYFFGCGTPIRHNRVQFLQQLLQVLLAGVHPRHGALGMRAAVAGGGNPSPHEPGLTR